MHHHILLFYFQRLFYIASVDGQRVSKDLLPPIVFLFGNLPLFTSFVCVFQFLVETPQQITAYRSLYFKYGLNFNASSRKSYPVLSFSYDRPHSFGRMITFISSNKQLKIWKRNSFKILFKIRFLDSFTSKHHFHYRFKTRFHPNAGLFSSAV